MSLKWADCTGGIAATWPLESFLGTRGNIAFFETQQRGESKKVLIEIIASGSEEAAETRKSWKLASQLDNPGLLKLHETGDTEIVGVPVAYAVLPMPEDDISEVLTARKLTETEARELLSDVAEGLAYLHARGLRHGAVTPPNLFITGEGFRLGIDKIARAGADGAKEDVQQLGGTIVEALAGSRDPSAASTLPAPFAAIAKGCFESPGDEWNAQRVVAVLRGQDPAAAVMPVSGFSSIAAVPPPHRWLLPAAVGVTALVLIGYWITSPGTREHAASPAAKPVVETQTPAPIDKPSPMDPAQTVQQPRRPAPLPKETGTARKTQPAEGTRTHAVEEAQARPDAPQPEPERRRAEQEADRQSVGENSWAVIAATYTTYGAAQHRADGIEKLLGSSKTHVFPADGQGSLYYVVLGSGMTQSEAERLRARALRAGAPRDSYVTKLRE